jgi:hypothetical protein
MSLMSGPVRARQPRPCAPVSISLPTSRLLNAAPSTRLVLMPGSTRSVVRRSRLPDPAWTWSTTRSDRSKVVNVALVPAPVPLGTVTAPATIASVPLLGPSAILPEPGEPGCTGAALGAFAGAALGTSARRPEPGEPGCPGAALGAFSGAASAGPVTGMRTVAAETAATVSILRTRTAEPPRSHCRAREGSHRDPWMVCPVGADSAASSIEDSCRWASNASRGIGSQLVIA